MAYSPDLIDLSTPPPYNVRTTFQGTTVCSEQLRFDSSEGYGVDDQYSSCQQCTVDQLSSLGGNAPSQQQEAAEPSEVEAHSSPMETSPCGPPALSGNTSHAVNLTAAVGTQPDFCSDTFSTNLASHLAVTPICRARPAPSDSSMHSSMPIPMSSPIFITPCAASNHQARTVMQNTAALSALQPSHIALAEANHTCDTPTLLGGTRLSVAEVPQLAAQTTSSNADCQNSLTASTHNSADAQDTWNSSSQWPGHNTTSVTVAEPNSPACSTEQSSQEQQQQHPASTHNGTSFAVELSSSSEIMLNLQESDLPTRHQDPASQDQQGQPPYPTISSSSSSRPSCAATSHTITVVQQQTSVVDPQSCISKQEYTHMAEVHSSTSSEDSRSACTLKTSIPASSSTHAPQDASAAASQVSCPQPSSMTSHLVIDGAPAGGGLVQSAQAAACDLVAVSGDSALLMLNLARLQEELSRSNASRDDLSKKQGEYKGQIAKVCG